MWSVAASPDGRRIVSGSEDNTVIVWDLETGEPINMLVGHKGSVRSVTVSPDGRHIVSASHDNTVIVWDLETGSPIRRLTGHQGWVWSVAVSPNGRRIVSGSEDQTVAVWDLDTGQRLATLCSTARFGALSGIPTGDSYWPAMSSEISTASSFASSESADAGRTLRDTRWPIGLDRASASADQVRRSHERISAEPRTSK